MTSKFHILARSPQDIIDMFMHAPADLFDRNRMKLTYLRIPGLKGEQVVVEALCADPATNEALSDLIFENTFSLPGLTILDGTTFDALQAAATARMAPPRTVTIHPESFSGCGDPTYRAPVRREGE